MVLLSRAPYPPSSSYIVLRLGPLLASEAPCGLVVSVARMVIVVGAVEARIVVLLAPRNGIGVSSPSRVLLSSTSCVSGLFPGCSTTAGDCEACY